MAKIPTAASLQEVPISADRRTALIDGAELKAATAPATALVEAGKAVGDVAETLRKKQEEENLYDADLEATVHVRDAQRELDRRRREDMPVGGAGFADGFRQHYDTGAEAVARRARESGWSLKARQQLNKKLLVGSLVLGNQASRYEEDEDDRHNRDLVTNELFRHRSSVRADPSQIDLEMALGQRLIERSRLNPAHRSAVLNTFRREMEADWLAGIDAIARDPAAGGTARARQLLTGRLTAPAGTQPRPNVRNRAGEALVPPGTEAAPVPGERPEPRGPGGSAPPGSIPALGAPPGPQAGPQDQPGEPQRTITRAPGINSRGVRSAAPTHIVLHHTGGTTVESAEAQHRQTGFAYHAYILPDGSVQERHGADQVVHHAGTIDRSTGATNDNAIGIAFVAKDDGSITEAQRATARWLIPQYAAQNNIPAANIWGHREGGAVNPLTARRTAGEGDMAREFREGRIPMDAGGNAGAVAQATPMRAGGPQHTEAVLQQALVQAEQRGDTETTARLRSGIATLRTLNGIDQQRAKALNDKILGWEKGALEGMLPTGNEASQVRAEVEELDPDGRHGVRQNFNYIVALAQRVREIRAMPLARMGEAIQEERQRQLGSGTNEHDLRRLKALETFYEKAQRELGQDPNQWASDVGLPVGGLTDRLDFSDDAAMRTHAELAREVGRHYGQQPRFFTSLQRGQATDLLRQGGQPMLDMLGSIHRNWGTDAQSALGEIADPKKDPELAAVAGMYLNAQRNNGVGMEALNRIANQMQRRREDPNYDRTVAPYRPRTPAERVDAESILGTAFAQRPDLDGAIRAAAELLYLDRARERNLTSFDPNLYRQGLLEVMGQSSERNITYGGLYHQTPSLGGVGPRRYDPVPVPSNMRNDIAIPAIKDVLRIQDLRTDSDGGDLRRGAGPRGPVGRNGQELTDRDLRNATYVHIGGGRYWLAQSPPSAGGPANWMLNPDGSNYVLDLGKVEPLLRERVPEIYRGYTEATPRPFTVQGFRGGIGGGSSVLAQPGPTPIFGPDHPDYPRGQFAPQDPNRVLTRDEYVGFLERFDRAHPERRDRERIMRNQSLYWRELKDYIDQLPRAGGPAAPAGAAGSPRALAGGPAAQASLDAVNRELSLSPQEQHFYRHHLNNLHGEGGIDQPGGARSTVIGTRVEIDGRTYILPTVFNGKELEPGTQAFRDAIKKAGGLDAFPSYATDAEAKKREDAMHEFMERDTEAHMRAGPRARQGEQPAQRTPGAGGGRSGLLDVVRRVFGESAPAPAPASDEGESSSAPQARAPAVSPDRIWQGDGDTTGDTAALREAGRAVAGASSVDAARQALSRMVLRQSEADDPEETEAHARESAGGLYGMYTRRALTILRAAMPEYLNRQRYLRRGLSDKQREEAEVVIALYNELEGRLRAYNEAVRTSNTPGTPQYEYYALDQTAPMYRAHVATPGRTRHAHDVMDPANAASLARFPYPED
jgi:N-acetylmuramoyl-L-alanine amidase-like protein